jgi:predicted phosphodiesterase
MMRNNFSKSIPSLLISSMILMVILPQHELILVAKADPNGSGFNFVAAGDFGCNSDSEKIFNMMKNMKPDLYLMLGDLTHELTLDCWFDMVRSTGSAIKVTIGNHDVEGSDLQELMKDFHMAKQYYSFDYHNAHLLSLSSELDSGEVKEQFEFASTDLAKAKSNSNTDWIIVFFHKPLYSGSGSKNDGMRDMYHPLFQKYHVDLVLSGHAHNYQRTFPLNYNEDRPGRPLILDHQQVQYTNQPGTVFAIVGTGGMSIHGADQKPYLASMYEGFGCLNVQINDKSLNAEFYTDSGKTIDHFTIVKNPEPDSGNVFHDVKYVNPLE